MRRENSLRERCATPVKCVGVYLYDWFPVKVSKYQKAKMLKCSKSTEIDKDPLIQVKTDKTQTKKTEFAITSKYWLNLCVTFSPKHHHILICLRGRFFF